MKLWNVAYFFFPSVRFTGVYLCFIFIFWSRLFAISFIDSLCGDKELKFFILAQKNKKLYLPKSQKIYAFCSYTNYYLIITLFYLSAKLHIENLNFFCENNKTIVIIYLYNNLNLY